MSDALTPKQEAFALAFFETGNAAEAYRRAYDVSENARNGWIYVEACQLLDNPKIAVRVEELQAQAAKLSLFTVKQAYDELEEARSLAQRVEQPGAAVSAISAKLKLFGLDRPGRMEITGKGGGPIQTEDVTRRDADDFAGRMARLAAAASRGGDGPADAGGEGGA